MMLKNKVFLLLTLCLGLVAFGCSNLKAGPDEAVARDFLDAYYVKADLTQAQEFTDGLAFEKVKGSLQLREGLTIDPASYHPNVSYKLLESHSGPEESDFFYKVEFRPKKSDAVVKKTRVKVRLRDGRWKVTQFSDHEL